MQDAQHTLAEAMLCLSLFSSVETPIYAVMLARAVITHEATG